jgi:two-component system phosphate regulon sensor histidine kinase PhoR
MTRPGPVTIKHLAVTVLVVVLVNAQLTWWLIFVLHQNRVRLELERARMVATAEADAERLSLRLEHAAALLAAAASAPDDIERGAPPEPFASWLWRDAPCPQGWSMTPQSLKLELPAGGGCVEAAVAGPARDRLLAVAPGCQLTEAAPADPTAPPRTAVAGAANLLAAPDAELWSQALAGYRRRILMMVSEGVFFAVMLFVLIGLLWRTLRREAELERQHRNFLSAITHELKSPLASMRLSLETVLSGRSDQTTSRRFLGNALQDAERLQDLVQKVLETTRYGHGAGSVRPRVGSVSQVVARAVEAVRPRLEALGGGIDSDLVWDVQAAVDDEALTIAVSNLVENAVKYGGQPPRIFVRLGLEGGRAVLEISDNGRGIAPEEIPFIFERFYRAGDELSRTSQGTGLGLYLVRQIIQSHRGTVAVASTGSEGTTFRVALPGAELKESGP